VGKTVANFSNEPLCPKPRTVLGDVHHDQCAMVFITFAHSMVVALPFKHMDRPVASFTQKLLGYHGVPREGVDIGIFVQERPHMSLLRVQLSVCDNHF